MKRNKIEKEKKKKDGVRGLGGGGAFLFFFLRISITLKYIFLEIKLFKCQWQAKKEKVLRSFRKTKTLFKFFHALRESVKHLFCHINILFLINILFE